MSGGASGAGRRRPPDAVRKRLRSARGQHRPIPSRLRPSRRPCRRNAGGPRGPGRDGEPLARTHGRCRGLDRSARNRRPALRPPPDPAQHRPCAAGDGRRNPRAGGARGRRELRPRDGRIRQAARGRGGPVADGHLGRRARGGGARGRTGRGAGERALRQLGVRAAGVPPARGALGDHLSGLQQPRLRRDGPAGGGPRRRAGASQRPQGVARAAAPWSRRAASR